MKDCHPGRGQQEGAATKSAAGVRDQEFDEVGGLGVRQGVSVPVSFGGRRREAWKQ